MFIRDVPLDKRTQLGGKSKVSISYPIHSSARHPWAVPNLPNSTLAAHMVITFSFQLFFAAGCYVVNNELTLRLVPHRTTKAVSQSVDFGQEREVPDRQRDREGQHHPPPLFLETREESIA